MFSSISIVDLTKKRLCVCACVSAGRVEDERPPAGITRQEPVPGPRRRTAGQTDAAG